ncbi:MAG: sugar phosphate isomerase/epimerase family protein [Planctomycetota bacterium]|jgi:hexulose-6-phosphate isomerase
MAKKIKRIRQINYWTIGGFEGAKPVEQALEEAKKMGFEGLELTFGAGVFTPKTKEDVVRGWRKAAAKLGMKLATVASGNYWGMSLGSNKESERKKAVAFTKDYLRAASWLGAKSALVIPGAVDVAWDPNQPVTPALDVWNNATKSIRSLIPTAKKYKVAIALENVWNKFLTGPFEMKIFIDQFKTPYVGCYFDIANCLINGYPEHWVSILGKRIKAVHFKNFSGSDCAGGLHGFGDNILKGDANFEEIIKALDKVGYKGPITAEMIPFSRLPDLVLPDMKLAKDTAKKLLKIS